jgi:hypothetical protein
MAQFDSLIIFPLLWSLLFTISFYYNMSIEILIPDFFGTGKFREKKLEFGKFLRFLKKILKLLSTQYLNVFLTFIFIFLNKEGV